MSAEEEKTQTVAEMVKEAIQRLGLTTHSAHRKFDIGRSFLARLASGKPPPRTLDRKNAGEDSRYAELAEKLGIDKSLFIKQVEKEQRKRVSSLWSRIRGKIDPLDRGEALLILEHWQSVGPYEGEEPLISRGEEPHWFSMIADAVVDDYEDFLDARKKMEFARHLYDWICHENGPERLIAMLREKSSEE